MRYFQQASGKMIYLTFTETEKFVRQATRILGEEGIN